MGYGGSGTDGIVFFSGNVGRSQASNQVSNQLRKITSALLVAERNAVQFLALLDLRQPVFDDKISAMLQYRSHSFFWHRNSKFASEQLIADEISEFPSLEWFDDDIVCLQKDSVHSTLYVGVATDQQRNCLRLDVAHRGNHRKPIAGVWHVEISDQDVEAL